MTKKPRGPTKGQIKAAAAKAEKAAAANKSPDGDKGTARPEATAGAGGVTRFIGVGSLKTLMGQVLNYQEDVSTASGNIGDLVRDAAANKHLHRGAFADMKKLYRMGKEDPSKLWLHLAHFDDMRKKLGLDEIAGKQGQMLDAGTSEEDESDEAGQTDGQPAVPGATVSRPKFGTGHKNFGDGHQQVIKEAVAGSADTVNNIAKAAGAKTPG